MGEDIIDISRYLERVPREAAGAFAVWGGEGERARFALPVWRAIYLLGAERGGIVRVPRGGGVTPLPFFVLDLGEEPARTSFPSGVLEELRQRSSPSLATSPRGDLAVYLGEEGESRWYLEVVGEGVAAPVEGKKREDILFLAGECAGLLFFRDLAWRREGGEAGDPEGP